MSSILRWGVCKEEICEDESSWTVDLRYMIRSGEVETAEEDVRRVSFFIIDNGDVVSASQPFPSASQLSYPFV
jgi:hypothetical protein